MTSPLPPADPYFEDAIARLLRSVERDDQFETRRISGGRNNQVFRIDVGSESLLAKKYFVHPDDPRDRLGSEFSFSQFAWSHGIDCIPEPLACDIDQRIGLYEFVTGSQIGPAEVGESQVAAACEFFRKLNDCRTLEGADQLPLASEANFSIHEHLECVDRRMDKLDGIGEVSKAHAEAIELYRQQLLPGWRGIRGVVRQRAVHLGLALNEPLERMHRCLSPSDFGFHNALIDQRDNVRFYDFEYAGWDDPAKTVCDFFCQVEVPVPPVFIRQFIESIRSLFPDPRQLEHRIGLLRPVYQMKWCCILLNDLLPVGADRRRFGGQPGDGPAGAGQVERVRQILTEMQGP